MPVQQARLVGFPKFSQRELADMARKMRELSDIQSVLVFPVSGSDPESAIFLLVTSDVQTREDFIERVQIKQHDRRFNSFTITHLRFITFCESWSEFKDFVKKFDSYKLSPQPHVDIMVVTADWQKILPQLELAYFSETPMLLQRLAQRDPLFVA